MHQFMVFAVTFAGFFVACSYADEAAMTTVPDLNPADMTSTGMVTLEPDAETPAILPTLSNTTDVLRQSTSTLLKKGTRIKDNSVAISRSNIFIRSDKSKQALVDMIMGLVNMKKEAGQDDKSLANDIVALLRDGDATAANQLKPQIQTVLTTRDKPIQLRQTIVKIVDAVPANAEVKPEAECGK